MTVCLVTGKGIGLPARPVEREHVLRAKAFAQRMTGDQRLELTDHVAVPAQRQLGFDAPLERGEAQLLEATALGSRERLRELGERRAAPETERVP